MIFRFCPENSTGIVVLTLKVNRPDFFSGFRSSRRFTAT